MHAFVLPSSGSEPVWPFPSFPNPKDSPHKGKPIPFNPDNEEDAPL